LRQIIELYLSICPEIERNRWIRANPTDSNNNGDDKSTQQRYVSLCSCNVSSIAGVSQHQKKAILFPRNLSLIQRLTQSAADLLWISHAYRTENWSTKHTDVQRQFCVRDDALLDTTTIATPRNVWRDSTHYKSVRQGVSAFLVWPTKLNTRNNYSPNRRRRGSQCCLVLFFCLPHISCKLTSAHLSSHSGVQQTVAYAHDVVIQTDPLARPPQTFFYTFWG